MLQGCIDHLPDGFRGDVLSAQTGDEFKDLGFAGEPEEGGFQLLGDDPAGPEGIVPVEDGHLLGPAQDLSQFLGRERPEHPQAAEPDFLPLFAEVFDDLPGGAGGGSHGEQHDIGVGQPDFSRVARSPGRSGT